MSEEETEETRVQRLWRRWEVQRVQRATATASGMPLSTRDLDAEAAAVTGVLCACSHSSEVALVAPHAAPQLAECWAEQARRQTAGAAPAASECEAGMGFLNLDALGAAVDAFVRRETAAARAAGERARETVVPLASRQLVFADAPAKKPAVAVAAAPATAPRGRAAPTVVAQPSAGTSRRFDPASSIVRALNERARGHSTKREREEEDEDEGEEEDTRAPSRCTDFMTAGEKLEQDEAIRNGRKPAAKPSKLASGSNKFVAPFKRTDGDGNDGDRGEPARKKPKSSGNSSNNNKGGGGGGGDGEEECGLTDINGVPLDDPRLKGIEPFLLERVNDEVLDHSPSIRWTDIAGLDFAKKCVQEAVVWPMLRPDIFCGLRGPPKGLLLFGPPGTGKTMIGKAIASESRSTFFNISASSLTSKWIGEGEKTVRALFAVAKCYPRSVIFIDEIDSILTQRSDGENEASRRLKTEFLIQLDGAGSGTPDQDVHILVVGATNRPQELDEAARRRLAKRLYIALPDHAARVYMLRKLLATVANDLTPAQFDEMGTRTAGYSGSDITNLCQDAALGPIRELQATLFSSSSSSSSGAGGSGGDDGATSIANVDIAAVRPVNLADMVEALSHVRASVSEADLKEHLAWNKQFGSFPAVAE